MLLVDELVEILEHGSGVLRAANKLAPPRPEKIIPSA